MKTIITIIGLLCAGALVFSRVNIIPPTTDLRYSRDVTDSDSVHLSASDFLSFFDFKGSNKWSGAEFKFSNLTDVSYNKTLSVRITAENKWLSNEIKRGKEIKYFQEQLQKILSDAELVSVGKENSSVYLPIADELNRLSQSKAERRIYVIASDLMENQKYFSFYEKNIFRQLESNPDSIARYFEKMKALPRLDGIEIFLIFQPKDTTQDMAFRVLSEFYRNLFETRGAKVTIGANL